MQDAENECLLKPHALVSGKPGRGDLSKKGIAGKPKELFPECLHSPRPHPKSQVLTGLDRERDKVSVLGLLASNQGNRWVTSHNMRSKLSNFNLFISPTQNAVGGHKGGKRKMYWKRCVFKQALRRMNLAFIRGREGKVGASVLPSHWIVLQGGGNGKGSPGDTEERQAASRWKVLQISCVLQNGALNIELSDEREDTIKFEFQRINTFFLVYQK